jgi:hypothetical protein
MYAAIYVVKKLNGDFLTSGNIRVSHHREDCESAIEDYIKSSIPDNATEMKTTAKGFREFHEFYATFVGVIEV